MEICFVTSNRNKFEEAKRILGPGFRLKQAKLEISEMQSMNAKEIARDKATKAYKKIRKPVIVEDTALYIRSWKGFPGPLISWAIRTMGIDGICKFVGKDRSAKAEACVAYYNGKTLKIFSGSVNGEIAGAPRGADRFDWDRIFIPLGFSKTFAEMRISEKNRISHRMKAFGHLKKYLESKHKI